jgi:two-component system OmpR family sensor kinase
VYGERVSASGQVLGSVVISYQQVSEHPAIPAHLQPGRYVTVGSRGGDDARYRVLASPDPSGAGLTIVAVPVHDADAVLHRLLLVEALVIAGVLALLGIVAWFVVRVGLLPLDRMGHTAGAIAAGDLSRRVSPADPRTEVGRLGIALNAMLDRLEDAFAERRAGETRLRRFLADASHELRTPLASIRGYAELFRMGAARSPEELEKAMRRIEEEAARMGVLVEDLLTLARLDQAPDARHEPVDVSALAADAVDDARATAPDRAIAAALEPGLVVLGDANGLRQVLGNLLRNALVHTPEGTPVEVTTTREEDWVRVEVRDHGPGLPPGDPAALFERFWRAEGGRERGRAGSGLGLAIVAGIVEAHGGDVRAADAPGGGASFTVRLRAAR